VRIKVMIVDDEGRIRRGIERIVISCGEQWEVIGTFGDGKEALSFLHEIKGAVDLVISDVKMPEMDGLTFLQEAKQHYDFLPLLISGYDDFEYLRKALREGAVDYILKPINREKLRARLKEVEGLVHSKRQDVYKSDEMQRKAGQLKQAQQTQLLSEVTSTELDLSRLGYWVDEFPKGLYVLMNISLDALPVKARGYTDKDWKAYSFALDNILGEVVTHHRPEPIMHSWWWRGESDFWVLLHSEDRDGFMEHAYQLAKEIRASIQHYTPFTVSAAQGEMIEDLYLLRNAKQQTLSLMNYRLILGGNQVFRASLIEDQERNAQEKIDNRYYQMIHKLKLFVEQADMKAALNYTQTFFEDLEKLDSPFQIQWLLQYLMLQIHSVWMGSYDGTGGSISIEEAMKQVKRAAHLSQVKENARKLLTEIIERIAETRANQNIKPIEQAKQWIIENLANDLTVKKIADHVYMNPTYFCKYFKTQTGETILDFVTRVRMEKARQLLGDRNVKLQEVCAQIGYQDTKYFSRLFKQWIGQSPSQYRESSN
jgi:two-component system response regulator YesN